MHVYTASLEAKLKEPIPTSCSTCEMHALKNLELVHYVDRLQDENDELRKLMGWLSGHEPQLRMMIEAFKRQDGEGLGANEVGEGSGENIPEPPKTHHINDPPPKPNHLRNRLDTTPAPPVFPPPTNDFQKPINFVSTSGKCSLGKRVRRLVRRNRWRSRAERNQVSSHNPSPNLSLCGFIVAIVGEMAIRMSFASRGSERREWRRSGLTKTSITSPVVYLSLMCRCPELRQV
jgi:hypothetical protein